MKTRRLLSAILAVLMVISMVAFPVAAETIASADGSLVGTIYHSRNLPNSSNWTGNPEYITPEFGSDGDINTCWSSLGMNSYSAKTQYYGMYYPAGAVIDSITFKVSGYDVTYGGIRVEVSTDATTWYSIWADTTTDSNSKTITLDSSNWDTAVMTEDAVWNYARVAYGTEDDYCGWTMLRVYEFQVTGEYVVPADATLDVYRIENPVSTSFGTKADLLETPYVVQQDGLNGLGFIFKVEGIKDGETVGLKGLFPSVSHTVVTTVEQQKVDEAGELVFDETGAPVMETVTSSEKKTYSNLGNHGNWVNTKPNNITLSANGYHMIYVPFNALDNNLSMTSVAGDTTINSLSVFNAGGNWNNGNVTMTVDENITISLVAICENDSTAGILFVKDADGTTLLGTGNTLDAMDTTWISTDSVWVRSVTSITDVYEGNGAAPYGQAIDHYVDTQGNEYAPDDFILGTATLTAVYGDRDIVKYTTSVSELKAGAEATVTVKVDDAALASQGKLTLVYDEDNFTCETPIIKYTEVAEDGTVGTFTVKANDLASSGDYTFSVEADATTEKGDVIAEYEAATVALAGQPKGTYFVGDVVSLGDGSAEVNLWEGDIKFSEKIAGITFVYKLDGIETPIDPGCLDFDFYYSETGHKNISSSNWFYNSDDWGGGCFRDHMPDYEQNGVYYTYVNMRMTNNSADWFYGVKDFAIFHKYNDATTRVNDNADATGQMLAIVENNLAPTATFYDAEGNVIATQTKQYTNGDTVQNWTGDTTKCYGTDLVLTPDEMFALTGVAAPTKADNEDGTPNLFTGWADKYGNPVEAVYYDVDLYPVFSSDYVEYDATVSVNGDEATLIITGNGTKLEDLDAGTINVTIDENVFASDLAVDGVISVDFDLTPVVETPDEGTTDEGTTDEGTTDEGTTDEGTTDESTTDEGTTDESTTEEEVVAPAALETDILATVVLTIKKPVATKDYSVALTGTATDAEGNSIFVKENTATVAVVDQDVTGAFLDSDKETIYSAAEGTAPSTQTIWTGNVDLGGADIATFIFKIEGVETAMDVTQFAPIVNGSAVIGEYGNTWLWDNHWGHDKDADGDGIYEDGFAAGMKIPADGTYYVSLGRRYIANDNATKYNTVNGFKLFQTPNVMYNDAALENFSATNTNADATFQMLAIFADDLTPTVNFYNGEELVGTYEYEYSALTGYADGQYANRKMKSFGTLASAADIFEASALATPTKASDDQFVYLFAGWTDADGNPVDAIYYDQDVYASFTASPKDTKYEVTFMNGEEVFGTAEVYENEAPTAPEGTPTKAGNATGEYTFAGWALTADGEAIDLASYPVTEATTLYAVYTYADVTFTVTYKDYNGKVIYNETVIRSQDAIYDTVPTRATDSYNEELQGGYKYSFAFWGVESVNEENGEVSLVQADLTNVQSDITVTAKYDATLVEEWFDVTWLDYDGTVLSSKKVAIGEDASTSSKGALDGKADENYWYTFNGWDVETTAVTADITANIIYTTAPVFADSVVIAEGEGSVGTQNDLVSSDYTMTTTTQGVHMIFNITGASAENPVSIGALRTQLVNGGTQIDSNNSGNFGTGTLMLKNITEDGYYYVHVGFYAMTWVGSNYEIIRGLSIDNAGATRGGKSSGTADYEVTLYEGIFAPVVRFYDEDGEWMATYKYTKAVSGAWSVGGGKVPTVDEIYAGAEIANFEAWVDADGNVVTDVIGNMDVYAKVAHVHEYVATGEGTAACECGDVISDAFTLTAQPCITPDVKAGDDIVVPVVLSNGAIAGVTFDVTVTGDATIKGIDTVDTAFDGFTAEYADGRVVLNAAIGGADITPADGVQIVNVILTAGKDMTAEDVVTVKVDLVQAVNIADVELEVYSGYVAEYTFEVTEADVLWGDVDGSGVVDFMDALYLTRYTEQWDASSYADAEFILECGDVDNSGVVDFMDALYVTRYSEQWDASSYADAINLLKTLG